MFSVDELEPDLHLENRLRVGDKNPTLKMYCHKLTIIDNNFHVNAAV